MASVITHLSSWKTSGAIGEPVIMSGKEGIDYFIAEVTTQAADIFIGAFGFFTTTSVIEGTIGADDSKISFIVPNNTFNQAVLAENNPAVALTRTLFFASGATIQIAIPIRNIVVSVLYADGGAVDIGDALMPAAGGSAILQDDTSRTLGMALVYMTNGNTTGYGAMIFGPMSSLTTKT